MAWKINGIEISETSKVNGVLWGTGKKYNGNQLNICYSYDLTNNNPPPEPPITFSYTNCFGNPENINIDFGVPQQVCALVNSINVPSGGSVSKGSRC